METTVPITGLKTIPVSEADTYTYEDKMLIPGQIYYYVVEAVDLDGKYTEKLMRFQLFLVDNDSYPPVADAGEDMVAAVGMGVLFDGRALGQ